MKGRRPKKPMRAKRMVLALLSATFTGCAPHITIADGTSGSGGEGDTSGGGSGGSFGGSPSAGTGAFAGLGAGGSAGAGPFPESCARSLPDPATFTCDWRAALGGPGQSPSGYCYKGGCHNATTKAGDLDLTPDDFLISRLMNREPAHKISCSAGVACDPDAMPP